MSTKPTATQRDLSLAYSPGVAEPCREIESDPLKAFDYTARGNLVGVISNGTAVLGLGDIGPLASKPVMEGKAVLFKRFADIDVFDLEVATRDVDELVRTVQLLEPTFGGINLEDIKAPECFEIERRLKEVMSIPVFHDDQHGTAIISAAALLNALEVTGRDAATVKMVVSGAGAAAVSCRALYIRLGVPADQIIVCDSQGVLYKGRTERMNALKESLAVDTEARSLADAMVGADVFIGLSVGGLVDADMLCSMADRPIVFAMANPDPEIGYEEAKAARDDVLVATGRSDFPNQVNNVLGFPFIFRGALDVRATDIDEGMKMAAVCALAELAKEDVPDSVLKAYGLDSLRFGAEYLIPKPFDHRVLLRVAPAVARAAMESGVARIPMTDFDAYERHLATLISRRYEVMHALVDRAARDPKRVVFPEGEHPKILRAAKMLVDQGIAHPVLLARRDMIADALEELDLSEDDLTIIHNVESPDFGRYAEVLHDRRRRDGVTLEDAYRQMRHRNTFGSMMVEL
ncbi:MAG: phosphate acyltransferase, partial [Acidobacteriota bacterium]